MVRRVAELDRYALAGIRGVRMGNKAVYVPLHPYHAREV